MERHYRRAQRGGSTYAPTTGILTVACANNDRVRIAVFLAPSATKDDR